MLFKRKLFIKILDSPFSALIEQNIPRVFTVFLCNITDYISSLKFDAQNILNDFVNEDISRTGFTKKLDIFSPIKAPPAF